MLIDRPNVVEGSVIVNATVPSGSSFPSLPTVGELFFHTGLNSLQVYTGAIWTEAGAASLAGHVADAALHLTPAQNVLLDGLAGTLTAAELNFVDGVTSPIQAQLTAISDPTTGTLAVHEARTDIHLSSSQNALLDALSVGLTATELNFVDGVTSPIQTQLNSIAGVNVSQDTRLTTLETITVPNVQTNLTNHANDATLHLTTSQNTLLDGITVLAADVNRLAGAAGLSNSIANLLNGLESNKLALAGGTMTGTLNMGTQTLTVKYPTVSTDAARKDYVDSLINGMHWFDPARVATTANVNLGVGGLLLIDGITVAVSDRVLVKNQSTPAQNGIYLAATGAWSRAPDYSTADAINTSALYVTSGATQAKSSWIQLNVIATVGVDPIAFTPSSGPVVNTAGGGITLGVGGDVSVNQGAGLIFDANNALVADVFAGGGLMVTTDNSTPAALTTTTAQLALTNTGVVAGSYGAGTHSIQMTIDSKGRIVSATSVGLTPTFASVTGKPTTLSGYGITDAVPIAGNVTMTGQLNFATGTVIRAAAPSGLAAHVSIGPYGVGQGDGYTHFGYNASGTFVNFIRGVTTTISGNLVVDGTIARNGNVVLDSANYNSYAPTLTGSGASGTWGINVTGSAGSAGSTPWSGVTGKPVQSDWSSVGSIVNAVGLLGWKNYGNSHVIFDASAGTSPSGSAVSNSVPQVAWSGTYPTLMGWNGASTYGVKVNRADVADNSSLLTGVAPSVGVAGSTIVQRDGSGYLYANYVNSTDDVVGSGVQGVMVKLGDNFVRTGTAAAIAAFISGQSLNITGNAGTATLAAKASTLANGGGNGTAMIFNWAGQSGQPTWLWGGNDISNMYVYNPSNFSVNYATSSGNSATTSQTSFTTMAVTSTANTGIAGASSGLQPTANPGTTGATISFHRPGFYGLNMGLDSDNVFRIGGWSAAANRFTLDMSGNVNIPGQMTAPQYSGAVTTLYGSITVGGSTGGYSGVVMSYVSANYPIIGMFDSAGNGGTYDSSGGWHTYWNRANACLGIGGSSTSPAYKMYVNGSQFTAGSIVASGNCTVAASTINSSSPTLTMQDQDNLSAFLHVNSNLIYFLRGAGVNSTSWDSGPNGRHPMTLDMSTGDVTFSGNVIAYSDSRLKRDIEPIHDALNKVKRLQGVSFKRLDTNDYHIGVIAQDIQKVVPEVVREDKDGYLSVAYGNLVALLIESVKELSAEVSALKAELAKDGK